MQNLKYLIQTKKKIEKKRTKKPSSKEPGYSIFGRIVHETFYTYVNDENLDKFSLVTKKNVKYISINNQQLLNRKHFIFIQPNLGVLIQN